jgi:hypothetical protein
MKYKYISDSFNVLPYFSVIYSIWQDTTTYDYYIDYYNYRNDVECLSPDAKKITVYEKMTGIINYNGSQWNLSI